MRITAVEEYGLRCLLNLARKGVREQMSIAEIARAEGLSTPYASKLLSILRRAGLVEAARGRGGGFTIAREPASISLYEVLTSLGGPLIDPDHCGKYTGQLDQCVHSQGCSVHDLLGGLAGYIQSFLSGTTLQEIIDGVPLDFTGHARKSFVISDSALENELGPIDEKADSNSPKSIQG